MKKYIVCSLLVVFLIGCKEDFLELTPQSSLTADQFYQNEADYETAIAGVYYQWAEMTTRPLYQAEFRSDNIKYWRLLYNEFSSNEWGPSSTEVIWGNFYQTIIHPSNAILSTIDEIEMDAATKSRIKGEALFFRGYAYYWLNMWFEGVPLVTKTLTIDESFQLGRSTLAETWAQAESDLSAAYSLLPPATGAVYGRVNKYAAEMFLARTYMQQQKWGQAETSLADIFNNSGASLDPDWAAMWTTAGQANSKENMLVSIWNEANSDDDMSQIIRCLDCPQLGAGFIEYEPGLVESFEDGDLRRDETVEFIGGETLNKKWDFGLTSAGWVADFVVIRFTDVQLLYAEAVSMSAGSIQQQSLDLMNETRNRAGLGDVLMTDLATMDDFVEAILAERRAEFVFESQRYADLKRHEKLVEKLNAIGYSFDENFNRIPIPASEIDKMNGVLVQNPGY
jgi:hypothetical protein